jgi:hypothetical protein
MTASEADITIVIPVRNDAARLRLCLDAITRNEHSQRSRVVVADNGSTDGSARVAASAGAAVLPLPGYRVGELRNIAAAATSSPLIAFVDADHLIQPGWVQAALTVFEDHQIAAAGSPYSPAPAANWVQRAYNRFRPELHTREPVQWLGSGNLIVRREAFERVGGFDPSLESCEDVDLCNRLRGAGYRLVADPQLRSVHLGDPATLRGLFLGELWRGRDNLKVTLRGPITTRALPSVVIPVVDLAAIVGVVISAWTGFGTATAALGVFGALTGLRAVRMSVGRALQARDIAANLVVAAVYDLARALSLVARVTHRTRRDVAGERAVA